METMAEYTSKKFTTASFTSASLTSVAPEPAGPELTVFLNDASQSLRIPDTISVTNTSNTNSSAYLTEMSDDMAVTLLPVLIYLVLLMIIGVCGNALVLYIHIRKFKPSTTRTFVIALAIFDIISCSIAIPGEIVDLRYAYNFPSFVLCKTERFFTSFSTLGSGFTLMAVAIDRYKRICRPLNGQLEDDGAKRMVILSAFASVMFSWPAILIYGLKNVETHYPGIVGHECSTDQALKGSKYPIIYTGVMFIAFLVSFSAMIVLYTFIGKTVFRQKKFRSNAKTGKKTSDQSMPSSNVQPCAPERPSYDEGLSEFSVPSVEPVKAPNVNLARKPSIISRLRKKREALSKKTTFMLFLISLVFVLSFLPHLVLKGIQALKRGALEDMNVAGLLFYNVCVRSYFINSVSNAFIYGFCSPRFRKESTLVLKAFLCQKRCGSFDIMK